MNSFAYKEDSGNYGNPIMKHACLIVTVVLTGIFCAYKHKAADSVSLSTNGNSDKNSVSVKSVEQTAYIPCEGIVLEFDPEYFFCNHDLVPEGSPHFQGHFPQFLIKLTRPKKHEKRVVNIVFDSGTFENLSDTETAHQGKSCSLELPDDFLDGTYKLIMGGFVRNFKILDMKKDP